MVVKVARLMVLGLVVAAWAGCQGNGGAVSVRWRVRDLRSGTSWDPTDIAHRDRTETGVCCPIANNDVCTEQNAWIVDGVQIVLRDPATGDINRDPHLGNFSYRCAEREATTDWSLPVGRWAVSLIAQAHDYNGMTVQAATPAPEVRDLTAGGVVNLQVIEVAVDPLPLPTPASMATQ
jgi:hypothetical protein